MHALSFVLAVGLASASPIVVVFPWSRATPPGAPAAVGFLTVRNDGDTDDKLLSAASSWAGQVQLHQMSIESGVMKMRELKEGLVVKAHSSVVLAPGGLHLMLVDLKRPLDVGATVPITLVFEKAGAMNVALSVGAIDATGPPPQKTTAPTAPTTTTAPKTTTTAPTPTPPPTTTTPAGRAP